VKDAQGREMTCIGGWNAPGNCGHLTSALSAVHKNAHARGGGYQERCDTCSDGRTGGCALHRGAAQLKRSGNVAESTLVHDTVLFCNKTSVHEVQGARQLLPSQVRLIRDHCINSNDKCLVEIYIMLLLSIYMFMRKMEVQQLTDASFNKEMFVMTEPFLIDALHIKILGKAKQTREHGKCWYTILGKL
jgi:hypothetical protein